MLVVKSRAALRVQCVFRGLRARAQAGGRVWEDERVGRKGQQTIVDYKGGGTQEALEHLVWASSC